LRCQFSIPYDIAGGPNGIYLRASALNFTASHRTWVTDNSDAIYSFARARLVLPKGFGSASSQPDIMGMGALEASGARRITWGLPSGPLPPWVRVGVTLDRGNRGVDHLTTSLWLGPRPTPRNAGRLIHLGGLLTLRLARG